MSGAVNSSYFDGAFSSAGKTDAKSVSGSTNYMPLDLMWGGVGMSLAKTAFGFGDSEGGAGAGSMFG